MRVNRRGFLAIAFLLLPLFLLVVAKARGDREEITGRWDIISLQPPPPAAPRNVFPGGIASARGNDGSKITLTGSGTFEPGEADDVTGGGTWKTVSPPGGQSRSGTLPGKTLSRCERAPRAQTARRMDRGWTETTDST